MISKELGDSYVKNLFVGEMQELCSTSKTTLPFDRLQARANTVREVSINRSFSFVLRSTYLLSRFYSSDEFSVLVKSGMFKVSQTQVLLQRSSFLFILEGIELVQDV